MDKDHNNHRFIMYFGFYLKLERLFILMMFLSFIFSIIWVVMVQEIDSHLDNSELNFITKYKLSKGEVDPINFALIAVYFTFSSLSTVGFGDFAP